MNQKSSFINLFIVCMLLGACSNDKKPDQAMNQQKPIADSIKTENVFVYECGESKQFTAHVQPERARLFLSDTTVTVEKTPSASGAKYGNEQSMYWSKGNEALLAIDNKLYKGCKSIPQERSWAAARLRGVDFRGLGQEPGWYLEISRDEQIKYVGNYGEDTLFMPLPEPKKLQSGKTLYESETESHSLRIEISDKPCTDVMSGFKFPSTVVITVDGKSYNGCGRRLN